MITRKLFFVICLPLLFQNVTANASWHSADVRSVERLLLSTVGNNAYIIRWNGPRTGTQGFFRIIRTAEQGIPESEKVILLK